MLKKEGSVQTLNISEFKAKCLKLLDETGKKGQEYTITKKGVPIARVIPIHPMPREGFLRGSMKGLIHIRGDIVHFDTSDLWEVLKDEPSD